MRCLGTQSGPRAPAIDDGRRRNSGVHDPVSTPEETTTRRLAAIVCLDVVGYSTLVGQDEEGTFARLQSFRRQILEPLVRRHNGRIVKGTGDGALAEFASPVEAVRCAIDIQGWVNTRETMTAPEKRLMLRVGINLGDVIVGSDGDIYGDGVNVAARLEGLCEPGGVCLARSVRDQVRDKIPFTFEDLGEHSVKNIARPVRVFALRADAVPPPPTDLDPAARDDARIPDSAAPKRSSVAVLPFANLSGDPDQEYFADGISEDIIIGLYHWALQESRSPRDLS
jgi:adenylate cyclase